MTVTDSHGTIKRTYDALNRVTSYTDTYGNVIRFEYDAVGNLSRLIYPDNTAVTYAYDENRNLIRVTDWAGRITSYTYDVNNRVIGVIKPNGSTTTTVYDNKQRVTSTVEKTASGAVQDIIGTTALVLVIFLPILAHINFVQYFYCKKYKISCDEYGNTTSPNLEYHKKQKRKNIERKEEVLEQTNISKGKSVKRTFHC